MWTFARTTHFSLNKKALQLFNTNRMILLYLCSILFPFYDGAFYHRKYPHQNFRETINTHIIFRNH